MKLSDAGLDFLTKCEGYSGKVYKDSAGKDTVGYGHLLTAQDKKRGTYTEGIDEEQARDLLAADVGLATRAVDRYVRVELEQHQADVIICWCYNLGSGALRSSTLLKKINAGDFEAVPNELRKWVNSGGRRTAGLVKRREAEAQIWMTGKYPKRVY
jgi:lysozyme